MIKLQDNIVIVETDATKTVQPSAIWKEILRVGFVPANMEIWAEGVLDSCSFHLDGARWPLVGRGPATAERRKVHLKVIEGRTDPPKVQLLN